MSRGTGEGQKRQNFQSNRKQSTVSTRSRICADRVGMGTREKVSLDIAASEETKGTKSGRFA
jgi:hypothetical protein